MAVVNRIAGYAEELKAWRHWMHRNPELGFDLPKTSAFVAERLREFGVDEIHEGIAETGIVAIINGRCNGPTIGLRADMDALPIAEATGAGHASETPGKMHACGHDGHTTMLLGAARYLAETRNFGGRVALIFQPAEEIGDGGAVRMVAEGIMERFDIAEVYGLHTNPRAALGVFETRPGPFLSSADEFRITVTGKGGHGANPHLCIDPIPVLVSISQALSTITARNRAPAEMLGLSVTQIHAGTAHNIIPEAGWLGGTVRAYSTATQDMVEKRITEIAMGHGTAFGVEVSVDYNRDVFATVNDADKALLAAEVAREIVGETSVTADAAPRNGSEDFGAMLAARPGAFLFLGQGEGPNLHDPAFDFNDEVAPIGASFFARLVERVQPVTAA